MALGSFFFVVDDANVSRKAMYLAPESPQIEIGDNEYLRIRTGHSDKSYVLTLLADAQLFTYKKELDVKRKIVELIGGVILERDVNTEIHKDALKMFVEKMAEFKDKPNGDLIILIEQRHAQHFDKPQFILDQKEIEKRLTDKVKALNKRGKFDDANILLDKIKKIPKKLYSAHDAAEKAYKNRDFDKAEREYANAKKHAENLGEKDLVSMYKSKINLARKTPSLLKKRDDFVDNALSSLKAADFTKAQRFFKKASEASEDLMDSTRSEEYALKAKALAEYVKVDKKFKR